MVAMPIILELGKWRWEDQKVELSLGSLGSSTVAWATKWLSMRIYVLQGQKLLIKTNKQTWISRCPEISFVRYREVAFLVILLKYYCSVTLENQRRISLYKLTQLRHCRFFSLQMSYYFFSFLKLVLGVGWGQHAHAMDRGQLLGVLSFYHVSSREETHNL